MIFTRDTIRLVTGVTGLLGLPLRCWRRQTPGAWLVLAWLVAAPAAMAQAPIELKLAHWVPVSHPVHSALQAWASSIAADSNGTIRIVIYPSEALGKAFDHYDMARDGVADITWVSPGYQPGRFPIIAAGELPFLITDAKSGSAALDEWYRPYAKREMKDVHFCLAFVNDPGTFHARKKVARPEDVRGLKVRPANGTIGNFITLLGGTNVQASAPEARDILERGVADAITFQWGSMMLFGIDKVVTHHLDAKLYVADFVLVMNKAKYESLATAQKKVIDSHCTTEWAQRIASPWADFEINGRKKLMSERPAEIDKISPDDLAAWRSTAQPLVNKWKADVRKLNVDADEAMAAFKVRIAKHQAGY